MIRTTTSIIILAAMTAATQGAGTANSSVDSLNSRVTAIEKRLIAVETSLGGSREQAMMSATSSNTTYVIQDGDTLGSIATKHDIPRTELLESNKLREGQPIYIGETLVIPSAPKKMANNDNVSKSRLAPPPVPEKESPKKLEPKKTEAKKSPALVEKKAPAPEKKTPAAVTHTVRSGDTLHRIARKYKTTVASIKGANGLRSDVISPGQQLKISRKAPSSKGVAKTNAKSSKTNEKVSSYDNPLLATSENYGYYSVAKGDNLYALARDFFTSMPELQRLNRLGKSTVIHPGDELIVPTTKYNAYHKNVAAQ